MGISVFDNVLYRINYSTEEMRQIFDEKNLLRKWLDVEVALAKAEAKHGLIPEKAAREIEKAAVVANLDKDILVEAAETTGHPFMPLLRAFVPLCGKSGGYVHLGATTQDIMDSAQMLQVKEAHSLILKKTNELYNILIKRTEETRHMIIMGRTNGQHALPITVGFKLAVLSAEMKRHIERLEEVEDRLFVGQFSGAVGSLASLSEKGLQVRESFFEELGLNSPPITWNTSRDNLVEEASILGILASTLSKIGNEIYLLQKQEFSEYEEYTGSGAIGSSTMPHKKNPFDSMRIVSLYRLSRQEVFSAFETLDHEHERDPRALSVEWDYVHRIFIFVDKALSLSIKVMEGLIFKLENMKKNINILKGLVFSESIMMKLSSVFGRQKAHDLLHSIAIEALDKDRSLKEMLMEREDIMKHLTEAEIDESLKPENYLGYVDDFIQKVLDDYKK